MTHLGIVGTGFMGQGIARTALSHGLDVTLFDAAPGAASTARQRILDDVERSAARKAETIDLARLGEALHVAGDLEDLRVATSIIEAVPEDLDLKRGIFERLGALDDTPRLLATNTSSIPITAIAASTRSADRIIGMHFFAPAHATRLCEIVRGFETSDEAVSRAQELARALGKEYITLTRDDAGFVTSRLMAVLVQEAARILESGIATAEDIDRACVLGFGHRLGPLATTDITGVDVAVNASTRILEATGREAFRPPELMQRMVTAGRLGRKSMKGFFEYE